MPYCSLRAVAGSDQSRKFDVLGEEGLIGESLFRSQETQVLRGNVRCREGSAIVSVLENNTDPMSGLRQLRDDAYRDTVSTVLSLSGR